MNNKLHINGIAHIALNVSNISKSKLFYDKILPHLGMKLVHSSIKSFYYIGGRTGVLIQQLNKKRNQIQNAPNMTGQRKKVMIDEIERQTGLIFDAIMTSLENQNLETFKPNISLQ